GQGLRRPADDRQPARRRRGELPKDLQAGLRAGQEPDEWSQGEMTIDVARTVKQMFISGSWVESESGEHFDADSPVTGEVIAEVPKGTRADAQRAIEAAHKARAAMAAGLIAPALAAGNTLVWTPASSTSVISIALMECIAEADWPPGTANLVTGPGAEVGDEVAGHPLVDGVGFVGSTETGASVAKRAAGKHVMLELGGNGPQVVFADADIGKAVEGAIVGCYLCAGQSCTAGERILVEEPVRDE